MGRNSDSRASQKNKKQDVLQKGGIIFHASSVSVSGKALLFLGHSTAGKSTISQLLSKRYPIIADDKVLVREMKTKDWLVQDASDKFRDWTGTEPPLGREKFPVLAIMRIFKGRSTRIQPLSQRETCGYMMDAIFENDFQRNIEDLSIRKEWFELAAKISRNIEGWRLTFPKSAVIIENISRLFERNIEN